MIKYEQKNGSSRVFQRGAVSLFVVIFTALLVTIITVSFIALMIQGQRQATSEDLSRSAYDSAQAGVEDAKRALVEYSAACTGGNVQRCTDLDQTFKQGSCRTLQDAGIANTTENEVLIKQQEGDKQLQQAYTCVKLTTDSPDYIGTLDTSTSRLVPLRGVSDFNRITLEWFMESDLQKNDDDTTPTTVTLPTTAGAQLPALADWPNNQPALVRSQLIQFGTSGFRLTDFDAAVDGKSNANTLFLYPSGAIDEGVPAGTFNFSNDIRKSQDTRNLSQVKCSNTFTAYYACKATITLPQAVGQNDAKRTAYLRLSALYGTGNNFRIQLFNNATQVNFAGVQAIVDSTGRANDQFRRVQSRVELDGSAFPYPEAAVEVTGNLCKTFLVTDNPADYNDGGCRPDEYTTN
ncbi:hypothetical protein HY312_04875 [Candidatus Saccharibacteria bacterium]|nr:hypothetical protein [Candidatus Saccharibacteria bacterium]